MKTEGFHRHTTERDRCDDVSQTPAECADCCSVHIHARADDEILRPVFSASRVQHISDLHSKFTLKPHHVWKYGRHPICDW